MVNYLEEMLEESAESKEHNRMVSVDNLSKSLVTDKRDPYWRQRFPSKNKLSFSSLKTCWEMDFI